MRVIFMGTSGFAVPTLRALSAAGHEVVGVYCQPDRPAGRGRKVRICPIKEAAEELGFPVFQPLRIGGEEVLNTLAGLKPDCIVVAAYGQILPAAVLAMPPYRCINVHASLLPAYRGAAPIQRAIMNGESKTGISIMYMDKGLDTGDILAQAEVTIGPDATAGDLHDQLAELGADLLIRTLTAVADHTAQARPQPEGATYAAKLTPEDEIIDWTKQSGVIHNQIRGLAPWPGAWSTFRGEKIKIWRSQPVEPQPSAEPLSADAPPGCLIDVTETGLICQTGDGLLELTELQPAGKSRMSARAFHNGRGCQKGEIFL